MKASVIISALIPALILCCTKDDNNTETPLKYDYLPLEVGNYWLFDDSSRHEIVGSTLLHEKHYFLMQYEGDTSYYRLADNKVYVLDPEESPEESVMYNLSAKTGDSWNFNLYTVTLISKTETISINGRQISDCYEFYFDTPVLIDEEHTILLAPEIGFIQKICGECPNSTRKLDKANIDGKEIDL